MKNTSLWLLAAITALGFAVTAGDPTYDHDYDYQGNSDEGRKVAIDAEGNIYVAATCLSDNDGLDFVVTK